MRIHFSAAAIIQPADNSSVVPVAQSAAEAVSGFRSWSHNPKTGSVVLEYDPDKAEADDLLKHIAKSVGFRGVENSTGRKRNREELVGAFLNAVQGVNQVVSKIASERADLREVVPTALAATSVVSFVLHEHRGRLPSWSSSLYHSYRIFMQWHRREVRTRERAGREKEESESSGSNIGFG